MEERKFIQHASNFLKTFWVAILLFFKMVFSFIKIFFISPFVPLIDLWKKYFSIVTEEMKEMKFENIIKNKFQLNEKIISYTLSFLFLLGFTIYSVIGTPLWWINDYTNTKARKEYIAYIENNYYRNSISSNQAYNENIYKWFDNYNTAYNNRDCWFMKYISVGLTQWEKNYIKNIPIGKKYIEEFVYRDDYNCASYDNINTKVFWSPIDWFDIEIKKINEWKDILVIANGYFAHSKIENGNYVWLSRRKITLWKLEDWKAWRIHQSITIE